MLLVTETKLVRFDSDHLRFSIHHGFVVLGCFCRLLDGQRGGKRGSKRVFEAVIGKASFVAT